jgi:hypothetical protein
MLNTARRKTPAKSPVPLQMAAMQWAGLQDLMDVKPINKGDYACLAEIRDVLNRHGKCKRFGVALLHNHFDMADNEMLIECSDKKGRVLTLRPTRKDQLKAGDKTLATMWMLLDGDNKRMLHPQQHCVMSGHPEG